MSLLISAYKRTLRPPPRTAAYAPHPNLQEGGQSAIFSAPQSTWGSSPRHPGGREASEVARPSHQPPSPARDSHSRAPPDRPRRRQTRPGKSRGGESRAAAPVPRSPPTSRSRARRALPGRPLPSPWGKARPRGSTARRRPRPGEPEAAREAGTLGLSGGQPPPSRARQDAWGLVRPAHPRGGGLAGPGPGPPPQAGRIRWGPRPRAGGGRVPAAGRAGRPAGGRRVAAAPGLK